MKILFFTIQIFTACWVIAQTPERKIIVENNIAYFTTIHDEFQLASLHYMNADDTLKNAEQATLPAGRNYNVPVNPFSWDIQDSVLYAVNFLNHPLSDRYESLKKIPLKSIKKTSQPDYRALLMESAEANMFVYNDPYRYTQQKNNVLNNFFFDGIVVNDSLYYMVIANNNEYTIWRYNGKSWKHSEPKMMTIEGSFSLCYTKNKIHLIFNQGKIGEIHPTKLVFTEKKQKKINLTEGILIENRDKKTVHFLEYKSLNSEEKLSDILKEKSIKLL